MTYPTAFSNADDVNVHLNTAGQGVMRDSGMDSSEQQEIATIIISRLYGHIPAATIAGWTPLSNVPKLIRSIASRLVAAKLFGRQATADETEVDPYSRLLWVGAMDDLNGIMTGRLVMPELADALIDVGDTNHLQDTMYDKCITDPMFIQSAEY